MTRPLQCTLLAAAALTLAACSSSPSGTTIDVVSIPTGLPPEVQCLVDLGYVVEPLSSGGFTLTDPLNRPRNSRMDDTLACRDKQGPHPEKTEDEIRVVFDEYLDDYECLVELGYSPTRPPSFDTFLATWTTGPWMPIDGTNWNQWPYTEYLRVQETCDLTCLSVEAP